MTDENDRLAPRRTVLLQARCRKSPLHILTVELDDLSQGGCSIIGSADAFAPDDVIQLRIAGVKPIEAQVRWREGNRVGVEFLAALPKLQIDELSRLYGIDPPV